jgi:hypothetical protein
VWLRWYDRMLSGARVSDEEEMLYAHDELLPLWEKEDGYLEVSAWLADKLAALDARAAIEKVLQELDEEISLPPSSSIPPPSPIGLALGPSKSGPLQVLPDPNSFVDAEQADLYNRLRRQLLRMVEDVPSQELGSVRAVIDDSQWADVKFKKTLWVSGNQLRSILSRHDAVAHDRDPHPDKLPPACAAALRLPVETWNITTISDATLMVLDAARLGPGERIKEQAKIEAASPVIASATANPVVMLEEAARAVTATIEAAKNPAAGINGDQAIAVASATGQSVVGAVLRGAHNAAQDLRNPDSDESKFAAKELRGVVYGAVGGLILTSSGPYGLVFLEFVATNASQLKIFAQVAYQSAPIIQMIDMMKATWDRITR